MNAHIICDLTVVHFFKCIFNLGPRAVDMLRTPRYHNPALLEDLEGNTQKWYRTISPWAPNVFSAFGIATISVFLQIFGILSWRKQESEEIAKSRFESRHGVEYKLREDRIQTRRLSWRQAPEGGSKLLWPERARDTLFPQVLGLSIGRTAACWQSWWIRGSQSCVYLTSGK